MKKGLIASYFSGIIDTTQGEKFSTIIALFLPEFITSFVLFALPLWLDAHFISHLKSTPTYATLGVTNNLIHLLFKLAEAASIGVVVLVGHFNGLQDYKQAGKVLRDSFLDYGIYRNRYFLMPLFWGKHDLCLAGCSPGNSCTRSSFFAVAFYRCLFYVYLFSIHWFFAWH